MSNGSINNITASINASTPTQPDIAPAHVALSTLNTVPGQIPTLAAGSNAYFIPFFHNLSNSSFSGDLSYSVYPSTNDYISQGDQFIKGYKLKNIVIAGKETRADAPDHHSMPPQRRIALYGVLHRGVGDDQRCEQRQQLLQQVLGAVAHLRCAVCGLTGDAAAS